MAFQSEIRTSQVNDLLKKVQDGKYGQYLIKVVLKKVRGFKDETVKFDFPITALVGPNGGGKTTILGAAACAYKSIAPRRFFAKSGPLDDSMEAWSIEYELIKKDQSPKETIRRTASFSKLKWSRDAVDRPVLFFGVSRTVPASERPELAKYAVNGFTYEQDQVAALSADAATAISRILGKDVSKHSEIKIDAKGRVTLLKGQTAKGISYSEFHFGAGESSIIRMISLIEATQENSLVLIEEIENGLHPVATRRMVEYLIDVAERKKIQSIFTTHSNDALDPLPSKAIWAAINDRLIQGKLDVNSLRAITGQIEAALVIFTEDEFAAEWVRTIVRSTSGLSLDNLEVHAMSGDGTAVAVNDYHNLDPSAKAKSVCIIDGDSEQKEEPGRRVYRLPGEMPESYVCRSVLAKFDQLGAQLTLALHKRFEDTEMVRQAVTNVLLTCMDHHLLYSQIGKAIGFIPETTVRNAFLAQWVVAEPAEAERIADVVRAEMPASEK